MKSKPIFWILVFTLLTLTGCVAKKKYLAMEAGRLQAEQQVRELTAENNAKAERIRAMIDDFEKLKNELLESNAVKDQQITDLNKEIATLQSHVTQTTETLEESNFAFEFEKRRLNNAISERDETIKELENEIKSWEETAYERASEIDNKNFELNQVKNRVALLENEKKSLGTRIETLQEELKTLQEEVSSLNTQIREKDAEILRLTNNVKLLKEQLGQ